MPTHQSSANTLEGPSTLQLPKFNFSPAERQYLIRQGDAIMSRPGATPNDFANFIQMHASAPAEYRARRVASGIVDASPEGDPIQTGLVLGMSMSAIQGATFGFGDEAIGTIYGLLTGASKQEGRDIYRQLYEQFQEDHAGLSFLGELAGGVGTGVGMAAKGIGVAKGAIAAGAAGAGAGAFSGFGLEEGGFSDRTRAAIMGGIFGGAIMGGGARIAGLAATLGRPALNRMGDAIRTNSFTPQVAGALGRVQGFLRMPLEKVRETFPGIGARGHADRMIHEIVVDGELAGVDAPFQALRRNALDLLNAGVRPTLADISGDGGLALINATQSQSATPAKQVLARKLMERTSASGGRIGETMRRALRIDRFGTESAWDVEEDVIRRMKDAARPLYEEVKQEMMPVSERTQRLLTSNPKLRAAWEFVKEIADEEDELAEALGRLRGATIPELPDNTGGAFRAFMQSTNIESEEAARAVLRRPGNEQLAERVLADAFPEQIPVRSLDYLQQALGRALDRIPAKGIDAKQFNTVRELAEIITKEAEEFSPNLRQARAIWRRGNLQKDASQAARGVGAILDDIPPQRFTDKHPELIKRELAFLRQKEEEMGEALVDFYRLGAMQDIDDLIMGPIARNEGADLGSRLGGRIYRNPQDLDAQRIRALFVDAPEAADEFLRHVVAQKELVRTANAAGAGRVSGGNIAEDVEEAALGALPSPRMTPELTAASDLYLSFQRSTKKFKSRIADEVAGIFSYGLDNPAELFDYIDDLERAAQQRRALERFGNKARTGLQIALSSQIGKIGS